MNQHGIISYFALNFLGTALKQKFTYSRIFYFVCIYVLITVASLNEVDTVIPNYQIEVLLAVKTHLIMPSGKLVEQKNPSIYIHTKKFNFDDKVKFLTERNKELLKSSLKVSKERYIPILYMFWSNQAPL